MATKPEDVDPSYVNTRFGEFLRGDEEDRQMDAEDRRLDAARSLLRPKPPKPLPPYLP